MSKNIYVTQPSLPPLEQMIPYLQDIWNSKILTNGGPMHEKLEQALCQYLGVKHLCLFTNATIALITALQSFDITGEVITTPYSFVATSHALMWNNISPVFVDIDPKTLNLDPQKIEAAITPHTTAIMPVHCYGNICDVNAIANIASKYNLKVIYDAAHAFGVADHKGTVLRHGDLSILSFHATKVFNTFEGGAIICHSADMQKKINQLKNFGFVSEISVERVGINGKMSEFNAAFGLLQLKYVDYFIEKRQVIDTLYRQKIARIHGIKPLDIDNKIKNNYSYFPIFITDDYPLSRDALYEKLKTYNIYARRYFYPLISNFVTYQNLPSAQKNNLTVAEKAANQILCLPIYDSLDLSDVEKICEILEWRNEL